MPDIGLFEIAFIGILAIILVKPDDWPSFLRKVGEYYGAVHRYLLSAKRQSRQLYEDISTLGSAPSESSEADDLQTDAMDTDEGLEDDVVSMSYEDRKKWQDRFSSRKHRHS